VDFFGAAAWMFRLDEDPPPLTTRATAVPTGPSFDRLDLTGLAGGGADGREAGALEGTTLPPTDLAGAVSVSKRRVSALRDWSDRIARSALWRSWLAFTSSGKTSWPLPLGVVVFSWDSVGLGLRFIVVLATPVLRVDLAWARLGGARVVTPIIWCRGWTHSGSAQSGLAKSGGDRVSRAD
jgi:hypothetical protein